MTSEKSPHVTEHQVRVLLVDDQAMVGEAVRRMLADEQDIAFFFCQDPSQAMATAAEVRPTVILQDLVMPDIDGLTLVRYFRASKATKDIPLIVLSTREEATVKAEAFSLGANDYLVKLPDRIELIARIRYHSRGYISLLQRNEALDKLRQELTEAAQYVMTLLPDPVPEGPVTCDWRFIPSTSLGGDTFGYHWLDEHRFVIYLLDVCGHGVGAALLSVSAMNVLSARTLVNTDFSEPDQVLKALNEAFDMDRHNGMYFTIWYGVFDTRDRSLKFASGGHPPALWIPDGEPAQAHRLFVKNMIIGGMPGLDFKKDQTALTGPGRLYLFSDGVYEINDARGPVWEFDDFVRFMESAGHDSGDRPVMDALLDHVRNLGGSDALEDDFSIVEIRVV